MGSAGVAESGGRGGYVLSHVLNAVSLLQNSQFPQLPIIYNAPFPRRLFCPHLSTPSARRHAHSQAGCATLE